MRTLEEEFRSLPDVQRVAWSYGVPPGGGYTPSGDWISDRLGASAVNMGVERYVVSPEFFSLFGIPILKGRAFTTAEPLTNVIVGEQMARTLWPDLDPIGRSFRFRDEQLQVVGLVREIKHQPSSPARTCPRSTIRF